MSAALAIVTGAGSGIGRATAIALAGEGHHVVLVGRRAEALAETADAIGASGCLEVPADVADPEDVRRIVKHSIERWGRVDLLVNNAAVCTSHPAGATSLAMLQEAFAINFFGPALLVARLWPIFVKQRGARVVNVSSMATVDPFPGLSVYAATKAALESLTRSIAVEGRDHGIRAFSLVLGSVETGMLRALASEAQLPRSRTLDPADVARVVVECAAGRRDKESGRTIEVVP